MALGPVPTRRINASRSGSFRNEFGRSKLTGRRVRRRTSGPIIPYGEIKPAANAAPATLDDLRARGELIPPVTGDVHILSGGFAVGINRGPTVAPSDQRTEFSLSEKGFTVFVTWNPQERLRGMVTMKLFTADNRPVSRIAPEKSDLRKQNLILTSWQIPMLRTPGVYRADVTLDDRVMWRGYVTIRQ